MKRSAALIVTVGLAGLCAPGAGAKVTVLHFFQRQMTNAFYNAAGKPIDLNPPQTVPEKGDRLDTTDLDYAGTGADHAARWTASDHLACVFTATAVATCDAEIAVGGSLLLATDVHVQFSAGPIVVALNGGTGSFAGAHGRVIATSIGSSDNSNLTVKLS